jgi:hypothetical protein
MSVGLFFKKNFPLTQNSLIIIQHFTHYLLLSFYNQLDVNIYQQHMSAIYCQQVIITRNTNNTRCMYHFLFITDYNPWGFSATAEYSTTLQEHQLYMQDSAYTLNTN